MLVYGDTNLTHTTPGHYTNRKVEHTWVEYNETVVIATAKANWFYSTQNAYVAQEQNSLYYLKDEYYLFSILIIIIIYRHRWSAQVENFGVITPPSVPPVTHKTTYLCLWYDYHNLFKCIIIYYLLLITSHHPPPHWKFLGTLLIGIEINKKY